jgi:hypothetical protein
MVRLTSVLILGLAIAQGVVAQDTSKFPVAGFLKSLDLDKYASKFQEAGYESFDDLGLLDSNELTGPDLGMSKEDAHAFQHSVKKVLDTLRKSFYLRNAKTRSFQRLSSSKGKESKHDGRCRMDDTPGEKLLRLR